MPVWIPLKLRSAIRSFQFFYRIELKKNQMAKRFPNVKFNDGAYADENSSVGEGATLGEGALVTSSSVGHKVRVSSGSIIHASQIGDDTILLDKVNLSSVNIKGRSHLAPGTQMQNCSMGKYCTIGPEVMVGIDVLPSRGFAYPASDKTSGSQKSFVDEGHFEETKHIEIGNDVWIGTRAIILNGVKIGNGAIIDAGAVVTKDVPDYAEVRGVPAGLVRYRFDPADIEFLLKLAWWDKDEAWIIEHSHDFEDIEALRRAVLQSPA